MLFRTIILSVLFLSINSLVAQGPISGFKSRKGDITIAASYATEKYDRYFLNSGEEMRSLTINSYNLFIEAATGENISIIATLPYVEVNENNKGLQDASLWVKYLNKQIQDPNGYHNLFTAIGLSFPVGAYETGSPESIGNKSTVFNGRFAYQYQHKSGFFVNAVTGIDFQISPDSRAAWPLLIRSGYGGSFFYVEGWLEIVRALESQSNSGAAVASTGSSWNRLGATIYMPVTKWFGLNAGGAWITSGKFIGASARYNVGGVFKLQNTK